jgi:transposase
MFERTISDELWKRMEVLLPPLKKKAGDVGRPPASYRDVMEAIFWILRTGAQWSALPKVYPPKSTVHDRFQYLVGHGFFELLVQELAEELVAEGVIDLEECFIDGTFVVAKKGDMRLARPSAAKAQKSW